MRLAGVKELKQQTMALLKETAKSDIIITAHGKPMAVLHHLTEKDLGDYLIEHDPALPKSSQPMPTISPMGVSAATPCWPS